MQVDNDPTKLYLREKLTCRMEIGEKVISFDLRIEGLDTDGILTMIPEIGELEFEPGLQVLMRYYREDSAYQFMTQVTGIEEKEGVEYLRFSFPGRITRYQRRESPRVKLDGTVHVHLPGEKVSTLRGYVLDVSADGLQCSVPRVGILNESAGSIGKQFMLNFSLVTGDSFDRTAVEIRRVVPDPKQATYVIVQLAFINMPEKQKEKITQVVRQNT